MGSPMIAITGMGAVSPLGLTCEDMWQSLKTQSCGIGPITAFDPAGFDCRIAGEVPPFKIQKHVPKSYRKAVKLMSRDIELSVLAAADAVANSGLVTRATDPENVTINPERSGINLGAGLISCDLEEIAPAVAASITDGQFDIKKWGKEGLEHITPLWMLKYLPNMLPCHVAIIHDLQGPSNTITCAEASSHIAVTEACHVLARGDADLVLAGGAEAKVNPIVLIRQCLLKRTVDISDDQGESSCRPFDQKAHGSVFGEGAGILVLESHENACRRNADILAFIAGTGQSTNINTQYEHLEPDGTGLRIAIEKAIGEARIEPDQIDLIIPHGTAIPRDDRAELNALRGALGNAVDRIPVWPTKSMLSNTGAAAGALDMIAAVSAIREGVIPAARNCDQPIDKVNVPQKNINNAIRYVLCCSYTYGGQTAAVIFKNPNTNV